MLTGAKNKLRNQTIVLIDDDPNLLKALRWLMHSMHYRVKSYLSARDYLGAMDLNASGCIVMDVSMPDMNGVELHELILKRSEKIPIIFISGYSDVPLAVERLKRGAIDFLTKPINNNKLLDAVNRALCISAFNLEKEQQQRHSIRIINRLSTTELQIMKLFIQGVSDKQIANQFNISIDAVETHKNNMFTKTQAQSLLELADLAYKARYMEKKD